MTIIVWVLLLWTGHEYVVIDNIASERNCRGFIDAYRPVAGGYGTGQCIPVRKVVVTK